jgi:Protein of unknown function (DUF3365)
MRFGRFSQFVLPLILICAPASAQGTGSDRAHETILGQHLADLLRAARSVVSAHQDLINDPAIGDKGIDGDSVVDEAIAIYTKNAGAPPISADMPERERRLTEALIASMREIVEEHEAQIDMQDVGFKGFIPAVYGRLVSERFVEKVGTEALMKVTAPEELVRNRKARPDEWELEVIEAHLINQEWPKGKPFIEQVEVKGRPAFRMLIPEYYSASCLTCHGEPAGEVDVTGYPKEGGHEGDLAGAISITFFE